MKIEGTDLPNNVLYEDKPENKVNVHDIFRGKKGILLGINGAFTPVCSSSHLPSYLQNADKFHQKGYEVIALVTVNDPYVACSWKKELKSENKVRILADPMAEFTKSIGMDTQLPLFGTRSKRYAMIIDNNVIKKAFVEPDATGATVSLADNVLKNL